MRIFRILFSVAKGAIKQVGLDAVSQIIPKAEYVSTSEQKIHELATLLAQLIISILSLIKLIRAMFPNKIWKSPGQ